jgi:hypothetical protein
METMDPPPRPAQQFDFRLERTCEAQDLLLRERIKLAQLERTVGAIEFEYTRPLRTNDMNMGGAMVVWKDHHAITGYAKDSGHGVE